MILNDSLGIDNNFGLKKKKDYLVIRTVTDMLMSWYAEITTLTH